MDFAFVLLSAFVVSLTCAFGNSIQRGVVGIKTFGNQNIFVPAVTQMQLLAATTTSMIFEDFSFHDSTIFKVEEDTASQTLDVTLDFPVDWESSLFENKILRFKDAVVYIKRKFLSWDNLPYWE
ncbi:hypothetical protein [Flavisolibacter ginsenosidimutans]|uniref:Uncharacterized protein n=1 Tax=Flavisolibacter ginsenosidimutans TaxID=661481 RepID=A0A5B8UGF3_9BACT|nr:hypothetical protein [Flavisolibacter ginsenosidimutans]QEC55396.1 hypothetical protein FSB75_05575 [Flavisolibacter ginsenosidimutans]